MPAARQAWLITFADLLALLLALFVLLQSFRVPSPSGSRLLPEDRVAGPLESMGEPRLRLQAPQHTDYLGTILFTALRNGEAGRQIDLRLTPGALLMRAPLEVWTGGQSGREPLRDVAGILQRVTEELTVRVHVPTALRGAGMTRQVRLEALDIGDRFAARLRAAGFQGRVAVVLGPPGGQVGWTLDIVMDRYGPH